LVEGIDEGIGQDCAAGLGVRTWALTRLPDASHFRPWKWRAHWYAASMFVKVTRASPRCAPRLVTTLETNSSNFACSKVAAIIASFIRWFGKLEIFTVASSEGALDAYIGDKASASPAILSKPGGGVMRCGRLLGCSNPGGGSKPGGGTIAELRLAATAAAYAKV